MKTIKLLNEEQERNITNALCKASIMVDDGADPNEALAKAAADANVPQGCVNLMANAYNTSRSLLQMQEGNSLLEKTATFHLADSDIIKSKLFPTKTAIELTKQAQLGISKDYYTSPSSLLSKSASTKAVRISVTSKTTAGLEPEGLLKAANTHNAKAEQHLKEMETTRDIAVKKAYSAYETLYEYFQRSDCIPFNEVKAMSLAVYPAMEPMFNELSKQSPSFTKQAALSQTAVDWTKTPYFYVERCFNALQDMCVASSMCKQAAEIVHPANKKKGRAQLKPFTGSILSGTVQQKEAGFDIKSVLETMPEVGGASKGEVDKAVEEANVELDSRLRNINDRVMLYELMAEDPVIGEFDPQTVAEAFIAIRRTVPELSRKRMALSSMLRKYLGQGKVMEPFEIMEMAKTERSYM